jgi:preprotein translocase subunit SecF
MQFPNPYEGNYKVLIAVPLLLVVASLALIFTPGSPYAIKKGVDFKGGTLVTMQTNYSVDAAKLQSELEAAGYDVSSVKSLSNPKGFEVEVEIERDESLTLAEELKSKFFNDVEAVSQLESDVAATNGSAEAVEKYAKARQGLDALADGLFDIAGFQERAAGAKSVNDLKEQASRAYRAIMDDYSAKLSATLSQNVQYESASFNEVSASLSARFLSKALDVVIWSTVLVSIVVFLIFRTFVPSLAVLIGAACDVIIALGAMGLFGIPLTLASFAALLMLVGFSLDTDVLLTMRVIKRKEGTPRQRAYEAMKTGMTMSMALMLSFICLFILASVTHINTYYEVSSVALVGLMGDLAATWLLNAVIVLWYLERGGSTGEAEKPLLSSIFSG